MRDNQVVRAAFEKAYPMPFACGWNSMTHEYECIWQEHGGEESVEAAIAQHNDRYKVWQASRAAVVVKLPAPDHSYDNHGQLLSRDSVIAALEAAGIRVAP